MIREESIRIPFHFAAGRAGSHFLIALRDEQKIVGSRCTACEKVLVPARSFCPQCGAELSAYVEVGPGGELLSWTEQPGNVSASPIFCLVRLDGADTALVHRLLAHPPAIAVGARVRARFAVERTGSIADIEGFELAAESTEHTK